jgi:hypothetical protein
MANEVRSYVNSASVFVSEAKQSYVRLSLGIAASPSRLSIPTCRDGMAHRYDISGWYTGFLRTVIALVIPASCKRGSSDTETLEPGPKHARMTMSKVVKVYWKCPS